jgi:hypothetical protein
MKKDPMKDPTQSLTKDLKDLKEDLTKDSKDRRKI